MKYDLEKHYPNEVAAILSAPDIHEQNPVKLNLQRAALLATVLFLDPEIDAFVTKNGTPRENYSGNRHSVRVVLESEGGRHSVLEVFESYKKDEYTFGPSASIYTPTKVPFDFHDPRAPHSLMLSIPSVEEAQAAVTGESSMDGGSAISVYFLDDVAIRALPFYDKSMLPFRADTRSVRQYMAVLGLFNTMISDIFSVNLLARASAKKPK